MKITLQKWGASWCPGCQNLAKSHIIEKFARAHPEVKVEQHNDTARGSQAWSDLADEHGVKEIPVLVWKSGGEILFRSHDVSPEGIERQLRRAQKAVGE